LAASIGGGATRLAAAPPVTRRGWLKLALGASVAAAAALWIGRARAMAQDRVRTFAVGASRYAFTPAVIEVQQDELVRVVLTAEDIPHSFTVDEYRIAKRAGPGRPITFEFRADRPGRFRFYCNLKADEGCRNMRGTLVVHAR
jgi:heme/copper-type cytochrome/quinol oxidase subunit 2